MIKTIKIISVSVSLLALTSCSVLINNNQSLDKLNQELGIEEYENAKDDSFTITYELNGGTNNSENPTGFSSGDNLIELKKPEKKGYNFLGWYLETSLQTQIKEINPASRKSYTLYAAWEVINYTITYNLDGGTNNVFNPRNYNIENEKITFKDPEKRDYQFDGWFTDAEFTTAIFGIEAHSIGDVTVYAKWIKKTESIVIFNEDTEKIKLTVDNIDGTQITVSATDGFVSYKWIYDDTVLTDTTSSISINIATPGYHYITVLALDDSGIKYSAQCSIRRKDTQTSSSAEEESSENQTNTVITVTPLVNDSDSVTISTSTNNGSMIFTATEGFDSYTWIIDDETQTETKRTLKKNYLAPGYHVITVVCSKNNKTYSHSITVRKTVGDAESEKTTGFVELLVLTNDISSLPISVSSASGRHTFRVDSGYNSYTWYVDDNVLPNESNHITLNNLTSGYHYISVLAKKQNGETVSSSCTIRITDESSGSGSQETGTDGKVSSRVTVSLSNDSGAISIETSYVSNTIKLTATSGYSSYKWILDNEILESTTNTVSLTTLTMGYHLVTVTAHDSNGKAVSNYIKIRKTE